MKELSIEEKAKAYDEALKVLHKYDGANIMFSQSLKEEMFPELVESEDERVRKEIIIYLKRRVEMSSSIPAAIGYWIAWLEKQGEQKSANNVEPKFKVKKGEWYICTNTFVSKGKLIAIKGQTYQSKQEDNTITCEDDCLFIDGHDGKASDYFHLWTIQDAKDGDVLCTYECDEPKIVFILKGTPKKHYALSYYCYYNIMYPHFGSDSEKGCLAPNDKDVKPATKEQRDLLFQKVKEAGYEWDANKKELKKIESRQEELTEFEKAVKQVMEEAIECGDTHNLKADADMLLRLEQNPAWSEEDESMRTRCIGILGKCYIGELPTKVEEELNWLKSLKDRVLPQPKEEWSEEDETHRHWILEMLKEGEIKTPEFADHFKTAFNWLKSLRPQNRWKPSDEQMEALWNVYRGGKEQAELATLYNDLKKLREE